MDGASTNIVRIADYRFVFVLPAESGALQVFVATRRPGAGYKVGHLRVFTDTAAAATYADELADGYECHLFGMPPTPSAGGGANG